MAINFLWAVIGSIAPSVIGFIALPQDNIVQSIQITLNIIENFDSLNIFCSDPDDSLQNIEITLISYLNLY